VEIAKLVLQFLSVLIYPTLILTICLLFKNELRELLSGKLTAKYKDLTLTIEKQKKELEVAEEKAGLAAKTIEKAQEIKKLKEPSNDGIIGDYLQNAVAILKLNGNEYSIIEKLQNADDDGLSKQKLIEQLLDPRMDMHTFHQYKNGIEKTIEDLSKKGIIIVDKGKIQFAHKILKEIQYR